jgi:lauroyl/myristoyl acyltransferase
MAQPFRNARDAEAGYSCSRAVRTRRPIREDKTAGARFLLAALWLLHGLPARRPGDARHLIGRLGWRLVGSRRRSPLRNLELCFARVAAARRKPSCQGHFRWLGRSLLEARPPLVRVGGARLRRLIHVEGDVHLAERSEARDVARAARMALDVAGASVLLFQKRKAVSIYQRQSNPVIDKALGAAPPLRQRRGSSRATTPAVPWCARSGAATPSSTCPTWTSARATRRSSRSSASGDDLAASRRRAWRAPR